MFVLFWLDNKLPTLLKLMLWSQEKLANKFNFP